MESVYLILVVYVITGHTSLKTEAGLLDPIKDILNTVRVRPQSRPEMSMSMSANVVSCQLISRFRENNQRLDTNNLSDFDADNPTKSAESKYQLSQFDPYQDQGEIKDQSVGPTFNLNVIKTSPDQPNKSKSNKAQKPPPKCKHPQVGPPVNVKKTKPKAKSQKKTKQKDNPKLWSATPDKPIVGPIKSMFPAEGTHNSKLPYDSKLPSHDHGNSKLPFEPLSFPSDDRSNSALPFVDPSYSNLPSGGLYNSNLPSDGLSNSKLPSFDTYKSQLSSDHPHKFKLLSDGLSYSQLPSVDPCKPSDESKLPSDYPYESKLPYDDPYKSKLPSDDSYKSKVPSDDPFKSKIPSSSLRLSENFFYGRLNSELPAHGQSNTKLPSVDPSNSKLPSYVPYYSKITRDGLSNLTLPADGQSNSKLPTGSQSNSNLPSDDIYNLKEPFNGLFYSESPDGSFIPEVVSSGPSNSMPSDDLYSSSDEPVSSDYSFGGPYDSGQPSEGLGNSELPSDSSNNYKYPSNGPFIPKLSTDGPYHTKISPVGLTRYKLLSDSKSYHPRISSENNSKFRSNDNTKFPSDPLSISNLELPARGPNIPILNNFRWDTDKSNNPKTHIDDMMSSNDYDQIIAERFPDAVNLLEKLKELNKQKEQQKNKNPVGNSLNNVNNNINDNFQKNENIDNKNTENGENSKYSTAAPESSISLKGTSLDKNGRYVMRKITGRRFYYQMKPVRPENEIRDSKETVYFTDL